MFGKEYEEHFAKMLEEAKDSRPKVILTVGRREYIDRTKQLFESAGYNVLEVNIREAICDDVMVTFPNDVAYAPQPSLPAVRIFESKVDIRDYLSPLSLAERKRRERVDRRKQNKFAQRLFNRFRKK